MPTIRTLLPAVLAVLLGCSPAAQPPPAAPQGVRRITVEQPANRTGRELVLDESRLFGLPSYDEKTTVQSRLATDLRDVLALRGFRVADGPKGWPSEPALRTEIRRWEPYSADYSLVTVDVSAVLVEGDGGRELWRAERSGWRIPTRDARTSSDAALAASRVIAEWLVGRWTPADPPKTP